MQENRIRFHYLVRPFYFPDRVSIKKFLLHQLTSKRVEVEAINYIFCNDEYLLNINRDYLKHDTYTDIITFDLSEPGRSLIADIFISVQRVKENAKTLNHFFSEELRRVIFHGALHLAGYKDKSVLEQKRMREMEEDWLKAYNVSREIKSSKH